MYILVNGDTGDIDEFSNSLLDSCQYPSGRRSNTIDERTFDSSDSCIVKAIVIEIVRPVKSASGILATAFIKLTWKFLCSWIAG
jgi:hypothetical protein